MTRDDVSVIFDRLADHLGVPVKAIRGKKKNAELVNARRLMLYWMRDNIVQKEHGEDGVLYAWKLILDKRFGELGNGWRPVSYPTLARLFRKDHSTLVLMSRERGKYKGAMEELSASFDPDPPASGVMVEGL